MSGGGTENRDPFQVWLESSRSFFDAGAMAPDVPDALKQKYEGLLAAWNRFAEACAGAGGNVPKGGPFDPAGWLDAAKGGEYGDLWNWFGGEGSDPWREQREALAASREWRAYAAALERYRAVMGAAWLNAFKRFAGDLAQESGPDGTPPGWEEIQARWQAAAGAELAAAQRSEDFLAAQRDLIRARLDCSALLRGQVGRIAGMLGLPTRAEIDELHETVHALKRQLRALKDGGE